MGRLINFNERVYIKAALFPDMNNQQPLGELIPAKPHTADRYWRYANQFESDLYYQGVDNILFKLKKL